MRAVKALPVRHGGVYLISGGLGDIGLEVANWLARQGAGRLILLSRTGLPAAVEWQDVLGDPDSNLRLTSQIRGVRSLEARGVEVWSVAGDVADRDFMTSLIARIVGRYGRIDGVFHAAGVLTDGMVWNRKIEEVYDVLRPKVQGGWIRHEVTRHLPLDLFVCFLLVARLHHWQVRLRMPRAMRSSMLSDPLSPTWFRSSRHCYQLGGAGHKPAQSRRVVTGGSSKKVASACCRTTRTSVRLK